MSAKIKGNEGGGSNAWALYIIPFVNRSETIDPRERREPIFTRKIEQEMGIKEEQERSSTTLKLHHPIPREIILFFSSLV